MPQTKAELLNTAFTNPLVISYSDTGLTTIRLKYENNTLFSLGNIQLIVSVNENLIEQQSGTYIVLEKVESMNPPLDPIGFNPEYVVLEESAYWLVDPFKNLYREKEAAILAYIQTALPELLVYERLKADMDLGHVFVRGWKKDPEDKLIYQDIVIFSGAPGERITHAELASDYFAKPISM